MKPANATYAKDQRLLELVVAIRGLLRSGDLEVGKQLFLRCPCRRVILPPILIQEQIKERQHNLLKAKIEHHLRGQHGFSIHNVSRVLKDLGTAN